MSIKEFEGENVSISVSQLRTSISRLTLLKKLPADIVKRLLLIFQKNLFLSLTTSLDDHSVKVCQWRSQSSRL